MSKLNIVLYGGNGHQIQRCLVDHAEARLYGVCELSDEALPEPLRTAGYKRFDSLASVLSDAAVDLISLCSPRRRDQAAQAIECLKAGKHVYAEKPCAMTESDLDAILAAAAAGPAVFHEMAGTAFEQPYYGMGRIVRAGTIGEVVQVFAQKSYPYFDQRPQDEDIDGGLICQNGVHALRFIEHVAGVRVVEINAVETNLGNPQPGGLMMAASMTMRLENGGVASAVANYLNQKGMGSWGNEHLRVFGTRGFVEAVDGGKRTRLVVGDQDLGPVDTTESAPDFFDSYVCSLHGGQPMPLTLADELHPTRMVIRAKASAMRFPN